MSNLKPILTAQYDQDIAAATKYVDGLRTGSVNGVSQAFRPDTTMYGLLNGTLLGGSITNLYAFIKQYGAAREINTRLDVITLTTAIVKVDMENDASGRDYTDFLTLIKWVGGVIAKVFHAYG